MTLTFPRIQAGEYQVNSNKKMVGYIKKQNASKWIMYRATNPSMLGNPIAVKKTLRDLKIEAEQLFSNSSVEVEIDENSLDLDNLIASVQESDKMKIMREMLADNKMISLTEYSVTPDGIEEFDAPFTKFLSEEELMSL